MADHHRIRVAVGLLVALATPLALLSPATATTAGTTAFAAAPYPESLGGVLLPTQVTPRIEYGLDVAVDGTTIVVGEHDHQIDAGRVHLFTLEGDRWTERATLEATRTTGVREFGHALTLDDDTVVVGAHTSDGSGPDTGAVFVFTGTGSSWTQQAELSPAGASAGDRFGHSVSIDGDTLLISADREDGTFTDQGAAYVFTRNGSTWSQQTKLTPRDPAKGTRFGYSLALDGDTAVVSAYLDDQAGRDAGAAYVFTRTGSTWTQVAKLIPSGADKFDWSGFHVAVSGDTIVLGAHLDDEGGEDAGTAYVFVRRGTTWVEEARLDAPRPGVGDRFGFRVAVSGDTAVIGAHLDDDNGTDAGTAYVFTRSAGTWRFSAQLAAAQNHAGDDLARAVALDPPYAVMGAMGRDDRAPDAGAVIVSAMLFASAGGSYAVPVGGTRVLDRGAPYGRSATITWDLDGDGVFGETGPNATSGDEVGPTPTFAAANRDPGDELEVTQRATSPLGTRTDTATLFITPDSCDGGVAPHPFTDLDGNVHNQAISCAVAWGITKGRTATLYDPGTNLSRGQLASLITQFLSRADVVVPTSPRDAFPDDDGTTHERALNQLAALGIARGLPDGTSGHARPITREQVATFVANALIEVGIPVPTSPPNAFTDDDGTTHAAAIDQLAELGIYQGFADGSSGATALLRRDQAASLVARTLQAWIERA